MTKPRVRVWDLETGYNIVAVHGLYNKYPIRHRNILKERYIICGSWMELGGKRKKGVSVLDDPERFAKDPMDDYIVVKALHEMLSETDAIIAHYGDQFDMKRFKARAIRHGLPPLHPIIQIDTWKIANSIFGFNNNRLDYLGQYLGLGNKIKTDEDLWMDCLRGSVKAVKDMFRYNKGDVQLLADVYEKLRPWLPARLNYALFTERAVCEQCGSDDIQYRGYQRTKQRVYRAFQCNSCGGWGRDRNAVKQVRGKIGE